MQKASNQVALNALNDIANKGWYVPTIHDIAEQDAKAVGEVVFANHQEDLSAFRYNSAWSGTLLFTALNSDQSGRLLGNPEGSHAVNQTFNTFEDLKNILFAHVAFMEGLKAGMASYSGELASVLSLGFNSTEHQKLSVSLFGSDTAIALKAAWSLVTNASTDFSLKGVASAFTYFLPEGNVRTVVDQILNLGEYRVVEGLLASLGKPLGHPIGNETEYIACLKQLFDINTMSVPQQALAGLKLLNINTAATDARTDFGALVALQSLSAYQFTGTDGITLLQQLNPDLSALWGADKINTATKAATGTLNFSENWLADRANMLTQYIRTEQNLLGDSVQTRFGDTLYIDVARGVRVGPTTATRKIVFGSEGNDGLPYSDGDDRLYGMGGNDSLSGGKGHDYIEGNIGNDSLSGNEGRDQLLGGTGDDTLDGGAESDRLIGGFGFDSYLFSSTDLKTGTDTIIDADGKGYVSIDGINIADLQFKTKEGALWETEDKQWRLSFSGTGNLTITKVGSGSVIVKDFVDGDLGIKLTEKVRPTDPAGDGEAIVGDLKPIDFNPPNQEYHYDSRGNLVVDPNVVEYRTDVLYGDAGANIIIGGRNKDSLDGKGGNDTIYVNDLNDKVLVTNDDGTVDGPNAQGDWAYGNQGDDTLIGSSATDGLSGGEGKDWIEGGAGGDLIFGDTDTFGLPGWYNYPINGAIRIEGLSSGGANQSQTGDADMIFAGSGSDYVWAGQGNDAVWGGSGNDTIFGEHGDDMLFGEDGDDGIEGDGYDIPWEYGTSGVVVGWEHGNDFIDGGKGNDVLSGGGRDDQIFGGEGNDEIQGDKLAQLLPEYFHGKDFIDAGAGDDFVTGQGGDDEIHGGSGNDQLHGDYSDIREFYSGNDKIYGDEGNDRIYGWLGNDILYGGTGDDYIIGSGSSNRAATKDDDILYGEAGSDLLGGGIGNDILDGGSDNDGVFGEEGDDILYGGSGDDYLDGYLGDDVLVGGAGNDEICGWMGKDIVVFNSGDGFDTLVDIAAALKDDVLALGGGITASDITYDYSQGGVILRIGNTGEGIWFKNLSAGQKDSQGNQTSESTVSTVVNLANGNNLHLLNTIEDTAFTYTIAVSELQASGALGQPNVQVIDSNGKAVTWLNYDVSTGILSGVPENEQVGQHALTIVANYENGVSKRVPVQLYVQNTNDTPVIVTPLPDVTFYPDEALSFSIPGNAFKDPDQGDQLTYQARLADGSALPTWLQFDPITLKFQGTASPGEYDILVTATDSSGANVGDTFKLTLKVSNDMTLTGTDEADVLFSRTGNDVLNGLAGNDVLTTGLGNDTLVGGTGNDELIGGAGSDRYVVNLGDGSDQIVDTQTASDTNTIAFGTGIQFADLTSRYDGQDLIIQIGTGADEVRLKNFDRFANNGGSQVASQLEFADGSVHSIVDLVNHAPVAGNSITKAAEAGQAFTFNIPGNAIEDADQGDTLSFTLQMQDGSALPSWLNFDAKTMTVSGNSAPSGDYAFKLVATDTANKSAFVSLTLNVADPSIPAITGTDGFDYLVGTAGNDRIIANIGSDQLYGDTGDDLLDGGADADYLQGGSGNDQLLGGQGDDQLYAGTGNDTLRGGAGEDWIDGGDGDDTYHFARGDGYDQLTDTSGSDRLVFDNVNSDQLWFRQVGVGIEVGIIGTNDAVLLRSWGVGGDHIERIETADGKVLLDSQVDALVSAMAGFNPPAAGQINLNQQQQEALQPVLAASWH